MQEDFLYFPKRQLKGEACGQAQAEVDKQLSHEDLGHQPHGEVHVVVLDVEVVPVPGHVEQVGHEGDFRDGGPEAPGEEVIDWALVALDKKTETALFSDFQSLLYFSPSVHPILHHFVSAEDGLCNLQVVDMNISFCAG